MNIRIKCEYEDFIRNSVRSGRFASEEEVVESALLSLQIREASVAESLIDHEFVEFSSREGDDSIDIEDVRRATSKIPGSMAQTIIEEERADRI